MAQREEATQWRNALIDAFHEGDEARARTLVTQLGARKARPLLEAMLENPDAAVRQAAAIGLGELGGAASIKRLEHQLALEEVRRSHDGAAVVEAITQELGRIQGASARASLARRLERLVATGRPEPSDVNDVACALWRKRHPELLPIVRQSLEKLELPTPTALHGLLVLLEKPRKNSVTGPPMTPSPSNSRARCSRSLPRSYPRRLSPPCPPSSPRPSPCWTRP